MDEETKDFLIEVLIVAFVMLWWLHLAGLSK